MQTIIKLLVALALRLSFERAVVWGRRLGWWIGTVLRYRRAEVLQTIRCCFPEKSAAECRAVVDGMYENLGQTIMETLRFDALDQGWVDRHVEINDMPIVREVLARGKGAIMLTAHIGNFQLPAMIAGFFGIPIASITKTFKPAALNEHWRRLRDRFGVKSLERRGSFRACLSALKSNAILGFVLDQNMKRHEGNFVDFFGRPACTTPGLALLSVVSGSPVIPVFSIRRPDGNYLIDIMPGNIDRKDKPHVLRAAGSGSVHADHLTFQI